MTTLPIREATAGRRYLSPDHTPLISRGPSPHTPGYYDVETDNGSVVQVSGDYRVQPEEEDELPPEPSPPRSDDPWAGESTGLGRLTIVKRWARKQCENALRAIEAGEMEAQATVRRELGRQLDALAKVEAVDASTIEGRDELLRLRALETTTNRPGVIATIDERLGNVPIEGAAEKIATATVQRLVPSTSSDAPEPALVERATAIAAELGRSLQQIDLYTIQAMTDTVRSARTAAKACTDPELITIAWRCASSDTIRDTLARRLRALTGADPDASAPPRPSPRTEPQPERVEVRDLRLVPLPDGTADVWACPPGGRARRLGRSTDPSLAPVVDLMRRQQPPAAPPPADLGSLGPWLAAVKAAGFKVSITISSEDG